MTPLDPTDAMLADLGADVAALVARSSPLLQRIEAERAKLADLEREEADLRTLPVPRPESVERFASALDRAIARYLDPAQRTAYTADSTWIADLGECARWDKPQPNVDLEAFFKKPASAFWFGDLLKAQARALPERRDGEYVRGAGYREGLPAAERGPRLQQIAARRAELLASEERLIRAAAKAGTRIPRRPAIVEEVREAARQRSLAIDRTTTQIARDVETIISRAGYAEQQAAARARIAGSAEQKPARVTLAALIDADNELTALTADDLRLDPERRRAENADQLRRADYRLAALAAHQRA